MHSWGLGEANILTYSFPVIKQWSRLNAVALCRTGRLLVVTYLTSRIAGGVVLVYAVVNVIRFPQFNFMHLNVPHSCIGDETDHALTSMTPVSYFNVRLRLFWLSFIIERPPMQ
jgi:hypothetical protein